MSSATRVAQQHLRLSYGPSNIREVMDTLKSLAELDENLTDFEESFKSHFAAVAKIDPEVHNQTDALRKASQGIKAAEAAKKQAEIIVGLYPDDKTAPRAVQAADVMISRFQRHADTARKILRTIGKKTMPVALKKAAAAVKRALQKRLVDPKALEEITWVKKPSMPAEVAVYQVYLVVRHKGTKKGVTLQESIYSQYARQKKGITWIMGEMAPLAYTEYKNPNEVATAFADWFRGWEGIKGEGPANSEREQASAGIKSVLSGWLRNKNEVKRIEVENLTIRSGFRSGYRWEMHSESDYDEGVSREGGGHEDSIKKALGALMKYVDRISVGYGEKGWWSVWISLK